MLKSHKTGLKTKEKAWIAEFSSMNCCPGFSGAYMYDLSYSMCQKLFLVLVEGFSTNSSLSDCLFIIQ